MTKSNYIKIIELTRVSQKKVVEPVKKTEDEQCSTTKGVGIENNNQKPSHINWKSTNFDNCVIN